MFGMRALRFDTKASNRGINVWTDWVPANRHASILWVVKVIQFSHLWLSCRAENSQVRWTLWISNRCRTWNFTGILSLKMFEDWVSDSFWLNCTMQKGSFLTQRDRMRTRWPPAMPAMQQWNWWQQDRLQSCWVSVNFSWPEFWCTSQKFKIVWFCMMLKRVKTC